MRRLLNIFLITATVFSCSCKKTKNSDVLPPVKDIPAPPSKPAIVPNLNIKVYVGGGDNAAGAFLGYLGAPNDWTYVQQYADGYYINNFALNTNKTDATQNQRLGALSALFSNKSAFYETDLQRTDDNSDAIKIDILKSRGFNVNYSIINRGVTESRKTALKSGGPITILGMGAPWLVQGNISSNTAGAIAWRDGIANTDGSGIDGPLGLWINNTTGYREGSISGVKYAHNLGKIAMVMISPYESKTPDALLSGSIDCIQKHEDAGASPDIWAIEYYAAQIQQYPVTPEKTVTGEPAKSLTGVAYYLIRHLRGKSKLSLNTAQSNASIVDKTTSLEIKLPITSGNVDFSVPLNIASDDDAWVDTTPLIKATADNQNYNITYTLNGLDVTASVTDKGFPCFNQYRLKGSQKLDLVMKVKSKTTVSGSLPVNVTVDLMSHPGMLNNKVSSLQIKCVTQ
jgi:hypothetical protein